MARDDILIIVPARGGSKRLPGKNLKALGERPLIGWTARAIEQAALGAPCLLTTDDEGIAALGRNLGWLVPFVRPAYLASDAATTYDAVIHALDWWQNTHEHDPDLVMLLQATSPFRDGRVLQDGLDAFHSSPWADAVVGVQRMHCNMPLQLTHGGRLVPLRYDEGCENGFVPNGALYIIRSETLRTEGTFFPKNTAPLIMDAIQSIDIDTQFDWAVAEMVVRNKLMERPQ